MGLGGEQVHKGVEGHQGQPEALVKLEIFQAGRDDVGRGGQVLAGGGGQLSLQAGQHVGRVVEAGDGVAAAGQV